MATDTTTDKRELRYPNIVSCLSGKMERMAVEYGEDELREKRNDAYMIAEIFGFTTEDRDWTEANISAHHWMGNENAKRYFIDRLNRCAFIEQRRDDLWKEIMALQKDRVDHLKGAFVRSYVDSTGYQVSLYANGAEIAYTLRDWGGSPTEEEQRNIEEIIHHAVATYMGELALALRVHFDADKPLSQFKFLVKLEE